MSSSEESMGSGFTGDGSGSSAGAQSPTQTIQPEESGGEALQAAERERDIAEASRDRFSFLADVSRVLSDSLDFEQTLTTVAGMSLPYLDAWCIVDVITELGGIRRLAVLHPDPAKQEVARELHGRYPPQPDDALGAPRVLRTGRSEMVFDVPDETLASMAHDEGHLSLLRKLGLRSYVIVPMMARGRTLGAITFVTADALRRFGAIDVVTAEDLARRAAMAIDNARLHAEAVEARSMAEEALEEAETATEALRDARDVAESALKVRSDFLATMTHEVRTPLNAIVGYMQLLELDLSGELTDTQRTYVERTRDSANHLLRLVEDVLDMSAAESGRLDIAEQVVLASDAARSALAVLRPQAAGKLVSLVNECENAESCYLIGDEHRVRQILINLLSNSIKFTAPGGNVVVDCSLEEGSDRGQIPPGRWVLFRVRDTGRGVSAGEKDSIFEPFVQGVAGLTREHGGTGLGLSISRRLARLMGGDVVFEESPVEGTGGATFALRLPAATAETARARSFADGAAAVVNADRVRGAVRDDSADQAIAIHGLKASAEGLLRQVSGTVEEFVRRARADESLRITEDLSDVEIADHLGTLLTDLANSLALLGESGGELTDTLRDGSKIQRLIGELHGAHRRRLGWTEEQLLHEGDLIRDVCEGCIVRDLGEGKAAKVATNALSRLLQERLRASLSGYRSSSEES